MIKKVFAKDLIRDEYSKRRGGTSKFLRVRCKKCQQKLFIYQKDGSGALLRFYLDRIIDLDFEYQDIESMLDLQCTTCDTIIAKPVVYQKENRLAYRIFAGAICFRTIRTSMQPTKRII